MPITKGDCLLVDEAVAPMHPRTVPEVLAVLGYTQVHIGDIRDVSEMIKGG